MRKRGRVPVKIDWSIANKMFAAHCTGQIVADKMGISRDSLQRAIQRQFKIGMTEYMQQQRAVGRDSLRMKQFEVAMKGNVSMLIWLGKNLLGQRDKTETIVKSKKGLIEQALDEMLKPSPKTEK